MPAIRLPCVMLAREGSKRLPGKNKLDWFGKPLWQYALAQANKSDRVDSLHLVTDMDHENSYQPTGVQRHYKSMGGEHTSIEGVNWWREQAGLEASYCLLIQCTSPFINATDIDRLVDAAFAGGLPDCVWALGDPDQDHPALLERGLHGRPSGMAYVIPPLAKDTIARRIVKQQAPMIDIDTIEDYERALAIARG